MAWSLVFTTAATAREASRISRGVLRKHLAACVNVLPRIKSSYWWKGKIESGHEWLLLIKTRSDLFRKVAAEIRRHSSYECPEVISLPIQKGTPAYLAWLSHSLVRPKRTKRGTRS